jgi:aminoglycoside phosphotransferase
MSLDLSAPSDSEVASLCRNPNAILSGDPDARCLVKLSNEVVVKFGWSVTPEEAANQAFAYDYSHSCDLKVPRVFRYFRLSDVGYIVMEYIGGTSLEKVLFREHRGLVQRLALAIRSLFDRMPVDSPGPRNGGIPRGYLF